MRTTWDHALRCFPLAVIFAGVTHPQPVAAASLSSLGHAAGAQCSATDVNDSGVAVGSCIPGNTTGALVAWVSTAGFQVALPVLAVGKDCEGGGVSNSGTVVGTCSDANGVTFAVTWNSASPGSAPLKLAPYPWLLGLLTDVSTYPGAYSQAGFVAGQSVSGNGTSTAVVWAPGSGAATPVSLRGDNCEAVDVVDAAGGGNPTVLLNCQNASGTITPKIATPTGPLGAYETAALTKNGTSSYCFAVSINNASQILGTCVLPVAPLERAAFWSSPTATASVLNLPNFSGDIVGKRNTGLFLNDLGHLVYGYQTADGRHNVGYSDPVNHIVVAIPPLHAGATVSATGLGNNDLVVVAGENGNENLQAAIFNPASPFVVSPVPLFGGGANALLTTVSRSGSYSVGVAEDGSHDSNAVITTLP